MSLIKDGDSWHFQCDRCDRIWIYGATMISKRALKRLHKRRHFCPECVLERRNPEEYKRIYLDPAVCEDRLRQSLESCGIDPDISLEELFCILGLEDVYYSEVANTTPPGLTV